MITKNTVGFTKAELRTEDLAQLYAEYVDEDTDYLSFRVSTDEDDAGWLFGEKCCREAAEFFIELADELQRRENESRLESDDHDLFGLEDYPF